MRLHPLLDDGHKLLAVFTHKMWHLHVRDKFVPVSCDVVTFVALVGLDVAMDKVYVVPQLFVVAASLDICVHSFQSLQQNCVLSMNVTNKKSTLHWYFCILLRSNFPFQRSWQ